MNTRAASRDIPESTSSKMVAKLEERRREEEDKRAAEMWNKCFKDKANLRDAKVLERFWVDFKERLTRKYGNMADAYCIITNGEDDANFTFAQFCEILKRVNVLLEPRICRALFEKAAVGERTLSFAQLKDLLMQRTVQKLRRVMEGFHGRQDRVQLHLGVFVRRIMLDDATLAWRAADRFQRKLTVSFLKQFWKMMLDLLGKPATPDVLVDRASFRRISRKAIGNGLQAHDANFLMRLFHRVELLSHSVAVCDIMGTLVLLSPESDRCKKVELMFQLFDVDYDGCLLWDQLCTMFKCLCKQRPVASESDLVSEDSAFQQELSAQEGLHAYEQTRWHLQRGTNLEGEIVSLRELWIALKKQERLMSTILPGSIPMGSWSRVAVADEGELDKPDEEMTQLLAPDRSSRAFSRRTVTGDSFRMGSQKAAPSLSASTTPAKTTTRPLPSPYRGLRIDDPGEPDFKGTRTKKFQDSLRGFGQIRMAEFTKGWLTPTVGQLEGETEQGHPAPPATPAPHHGAPSPTGGTMSRNSTAPVMLTPIERSPAATSTASTMKRSRSSTAGLFSPAAHHSVSAHASTGLDPRPHFRDLPAIGPTMRVQRWGQESVDRFRLITAAKSGAAAKEKLFTADKEINFICQLCLIPHVFKECERR